ncbi:N-sulfoglucosamine sulfohydrolase [Soehngenia longivitae]|uniref:N-sulfoglucosamine sulfohydrolase n=1 Tax=Soehngenia longivitae TaxID=2562294 RepID=A0A4Z0D610_9FIRM|nr:sulfatase [Soehngenia longivitae]TFZ40333.1 N-sulfoglucosamine sulfohydrolase [Soehngenia longivitae]
MNILYIHTHDTGRVISPYGYKVNTPNIESFCNEAVFFQNAFSVAPTCSPSRAGLLTGVYPHQNGMLGLAQRGFELKRDLHIANILRGNGFLTALCGVQHEIGYYTEHEKAIGTLGYEIDLSADNSSYEGEDLIQWDIENAKNLVNFLKEYDRTKPFFISYGMHATHRKFPSNIDDDQIVDYSVPPINIVNNEITREDFARYQTSLKIADSNIGTIISALKELGIYDDTIIILTTDHGIAFPFAKCTLFDNGIGVMLAIRVPNSKYEGRSFEGLISHIDVLPTLLDLLDIKKPDYLEGKSFAKIFNGEDYVGDDFVFSEINFHTSYEPVRSVRTERYKYIKYFDKEYLKINKSNIDSSPVKDFYMENGLNEFKKDEEYLFDLFYDVFEKNNLAENDEYQDVLNFMRNKLDEFMINTDDPLLKGPIEVKKEWKVNKRESVAAESKNPEDYDSLGSKFGGRA